jgi:hypothetical protein
VIAGAVLVMDACYAHRQFDAELLDVPDLAHKTEQKSGMVRERQPGNVGSIKS